MRSFESLTSYITRGTIGELGELDEDRRLAALESYGDAGVGPFFLSYNTRDQEFATRLVDQLQSRFGRNAILWDRDLLIAGAVWSDELVTAMNEAKAVLLLISQN